MHTPEEALKLWCPMVRNGLNNRFRDQDGNERLINHCVSKSCMMWRWAQKPNPEWRPGHTAMQFPQRDTRSDPPMYLPDETRGYCGLAGRP